MQLARPYPIQYLDVGRSLQLYNQRMAGNRQERLLALQEKQFEQKDRLARAEQFKKSAAAALQYADTPEKWEEVKADLLFKYPEVGQQIRSAIFDMRPALLAEMNDLQGELAKRELGLANTSEPLVQVYDPDSPTGSRYARRSEAVGKPGRPAAGHEPDQYERLTPEQTRAAGLRPGTVAQRSKRTNKIQTVQSPGESRNILTSQGEISLQGQKTLLATAASAFGGTYDPITQKFSAMNKESMTQALEAADLAGQYLRTKKARTVAAAMRMALRTMQDGTGTATPPPAAATDQSVPTAQGMTREQMQTGQVYRLADGRLAEWTGTGFRIVQEQ